MIQLLCNSMNRETISVLSYLKKFGFSLFLLAFLTIITYAEIHFTNVSEMFGIKGYDYFGGHGVCWIDVNSDGKLDIYIKNVGAQGVLDVSNILYVNYGNYFKDEALERGVSDKYAIGTHGAVFCDLDNDRDFDLFSTTTYDGISPAHNHIYQNDGDGYFKDITNTISPSQEIDAASRGVAASDFDGDGDIDLYFSNALTNPQFFNPAPFPPEKLENFYINNGDGTFTVMYLGIDWTSFVQGVTAIDIDGDGDIDIAEAKWSGPSTIYLNDGTGYFFNYGRDLGLPSTLNIIDNGMTFADIDNDGDLDLAIIRKYRVTLYKNTGGFFSRYQIITTAGSFHVCFGDFDHDTDLDMFVSGGNVYENNGQGIFSPVLSADSGLEASLYSKDPRSSALGDFDNDGDLDIYLADKEGYNLLFRNDINDSNWIQIDVLDYTGGIGALGTKLDLYLAGHLGQPKFLKGHREIHGEYGYLGQDMPTVHFGAPASSEYDLKVTFLNGEERTFTSITPGQKIQVSYILPPLNFAGVKKENRSLFYRETVIQLTWAQNPNSNNIQKYRIYTIQNNGDKIILEEVPATTFNYSVRNVQNSELYRFALTAVDQNNIEGAAAYTTVK